MPISRKYSDFRVLKCLGPPSDQREAEEMPRSLAVEEKKSKKARLVKRESFDSGE